MLRILLRKYGCGVNMLDRIWAAMIMIGIIVAAFFGNLDAVGEGVVASAKEGIDLLITMAGVCGMWCGLLAIAEKSGLMERIMGIVRPMIKFIFPGIPEHHEANTYITENFVANILGLGWACTPTGLKAMKSLQELNKSRGMEKNNASDEMCTFLLLNISSLQLIPMNMIAYRSQYGSANPTAVVGPALLATLINTLLTFLICRVICFIRNRRRGGIL